jgi:hypothetical protein
MVICAAFLIFSGNLTPRSRVVSASMATSSSPSISIRNPRHLQLAYLSFFLVQSFDCFLFLMLSPQLFKDASVLTPATRFFIRANATTLFPFILLIFLLRKHHVSSAVGQTVAHAFCLFHGIVLVFITWTRAAEDEWSLEPSWAGIGFHGVWFASGVAALAGF